MPRLLGHELYRFYRAGDEETVALRGVSLQLGDGESVAVSGPSGSGKTTLLHILAGLDEPDGGQVDLAGARMSHRPEAERAELRARTLGILLQHGTCSITCRCSTTSAYRWRWPDDGTTSGRGCCWPG